MSFEETMRKLSVEPGTVLWTDCKLVWQMARSAALEECWEAVHAERLTDPTDSADDVAYNVAVGDCENAIRALSKEQQ